MIGKWLKFALRAGASIVGFVRSEKEKDGKVELDEGLQFALVNLLPRINRELNPTPKTKAEEIIDYFTALDESTGNDEGAFEVFPGINADQEEILWKHLLKFGCQYSFYKADLFDAVVPEF